MNSKKILESYFKKLRRESILKAFISGGSVSLFCMFAAALVAWFTPINGVWLALGVFAVTLAPSVLLFYFKKYRPQLKTVAKRLDSLGLDEKILTMTELEGDDSIMAVYQRNSALEALRTVKNGALKIAVSGVSVVALVTSFVFGTAMTTVNALSNNGTIPGGSEIVNPVPEQDKYCIVRYEIVYINKNAVLLQDEFGVEIDGLDEQVVLIGGDAEAVTLSVESEPLPDGENEYIWAFYGWYGPLELASFSINGENSISYVTNVNSAPLSTSLYRQDLKVIPENYLEEGAEITIDEEGYTVITFRAIILKYPVTDGEDGDSGEEGEEGEPSDAPPENDGEPNEDEDPGDGSTGGDRDNQGSTMIDGDTYYGDRIQEYYEQYKEYLASGKEIPDWLKQIIEAYYGGLG